MAAWAEEQLERMPLEQKVGQLICSQLGGQRELAERMIQEGRVGAITFYAKDMPDPRTTAALANDLQRQSPTPLIIASDFEAGAGRLCGGATHLPSKMALGATGSDEYTRQHAEITAVEARAIGVNMIYAPVVDVNVNPQNPIINIRSFGEDTKLVARLGAAWISGCQKSRALAVAKHFPGHGDTSVDSHITLPTVPHSLERMNTVELEPFRAAITAGVKGVMSAHILFPALEKSHSPATMSKEILTGLLRGRMGFDGLIVTDHMEMHAITHSFEAGEAAVRAVEAGCDLVLVNDLERSFEALLFSARDGRLSMEQINESVGRILAAKEWLKLDQERCVEVDGVEKHVGVSTHREKAQTIADNSVTLMKGLNGIKCFTLARKLAVITTPSKRYTGESSSQKFCDYVCGRWPCSSFFEVSEECTDAELRDALARSEDVDAAIFATFAKPTAYQSQSVEIGTKHVQLVNDVAERVPTAVISFGSPYALANFSSAAVLISPFSSCDASLQAVVDGLSGKRPFVGTMPVTVK